MNWEQVRLGGVCDVIAGQSPPSSTYNNEERGLPFFQGKADFGAHYPKVRMWCDAPNKVALPNDILLSVRAPVGPTNLCNMQSCIGRGLAAIRSGELVYAKYVYYYFKQIEPKLSQQGTGSTFSAITTSLVRDLEIPLPPLPVQQKIAAVLDAADALRQKDKVLLKQYDALLQSTFHHLFGDPVRNEKGWEVKKLGELNTFLTSGSRGWAKYYNESGDIFLRINNVVHGNLKLENIIRVEAPDDAEAKRTMVNPGDLLISITADLGRCAAIPIGFPKAFVNQHLAIVRLDDRVDSTYIATYLSGEGGRRQFAALNKGGVKAGLNFNDLRGLQIPLPPLSLQDQFSKIAQNIQRQKVLVKEQAAQSEALFQSLLHQSFQNSTNG